MAVTVTRYPPGAVPGTYHPGDFLLTHGRGFVCSLIRFGQGLQFRGPERQCARWNHAVAVSTSGLVEALGAGVVRSPLDKYADHDFTYVHTNLDEGQRLDATTYWEWMADNHARYSFLAIVSIAIRLVTKTKISFGNSQKVICSGLVAAGLGVTEWRSDPAFVTPAALAFYHGCRPE